MTCTSKHVGINGIKSMKAKENHYLTSRYINNMWRKTLACITYISSEKNQLQVSTQAYSREWKNTKLNETLIYIHSHDRKHVISEHENITNASFCIYCLRKFTNYSPYSRMLQECIGFFFFFFFLSLSSFHLDGGQSNKSFQVVNPHSHQPHKQPQK